MTLSSNDLLTTLQNYLDRIPFSRELNLSIIEARRGFVALGVSPQDKLFNHFNSFQAGVVYTLAELTGGVLCGTFLDLSKNLVLTKRGEINYMRGVNLSLRSEARLDENLINDIYSCLSDSRKTDLIVDILIKSEKEQEVAQCRFFYYLRSGIPRSFTAILEK